MQVDLHAMADTIETRARDGELLTASDMLALGAALHAHADAATAHRAVETLVRAATGANVVTLRPFGEVRKIGPAFLHVDACRRASVPLAAE